MQLSLPGFLAEIGAYEAFSPKELCTEGVLRCIWTASELKAHGDRRRGVLGCCRLGGMNCSVPGSVITGSCQHPGVVQTRMHSHLLEQRERRFLQGGLYLLSKLTVPRKWGKKAG